MSTATIIPRRMRLRRTERSEEHTSELQSRLHLVCRLLLEKKKRLRPSPDRRHSPRSGPGSLPAAAGAESDDFLLADVVVGPHPTHTGGSHSGLTTTGHHAAPPRNGHKALRRIMTYIRRRGAG